MRRTNWENDGEGGKLPLGKPNLESQGNASLWGSKDLKRLLHRRRRAVGGDEHAQGFKEDQDSSEC